MISICVNSTFSITHSKKERYVLHIGGKTLSTRIVLVTCLEETLAKALS
jgi:hypothetical protein